jgi:hypothetical protein
MGNQDLHNHKYIVRGDVRHASTVCVDGSPEYNLKHSQQPQSVHKRQYEVGLDARIAEGSVKAETCEDFEAPLLSGPKNAAQEVSRWIAFQQPKKPREA